MVLPLRSSTAACDPSAVLPLGSAVLPLGHRQEREDLSVKAEDEAVVPGRPAVVLLWSHGRYYRFGAVLPLVTPQQYYRWVARYYRWNPDRTQKREEISPKKWKSLEGEKLTCTC